MPSRVLISDVYFCLKLYQWRPPWTIFVLVCLAMTVESARIIQTGSDRICPISLPLASWFMMIVVDCTQLIHVLKLDASRFEMIHEDIVYLELELLLEIPEMQPKSALGSIGGEQLPKTWTPLDVRSQSRAAGRMMAFADILLGFLSGYRWDRLKISVLNIVLCCRRRWFMHLFYIMHSAEKQSVRRGLNAAAAASAAPHWLQQRQCWRRESIDMIWNAHMATVRLVQLL